MILNSPTISGSLTTSGSILVNSPNTTMGQFVGNQNGYVEFSVRNSSTGISASGDIAVYADNGTPTTNYIDMGINNSSASAYAYAGTVLGKALDAYLFNVGGNLIIGNANSTSTSQSLYFFANPNGNAEMTLTGSNFGIGTTVPNYKLDVSGSIRATGNIVAQTLVVQTISSSVVYSSGSNVFGNVIGNTHQFTGSVSVSGSGTFVSSVTANGGFISAGSPNGYPLGELQFSPTTAGSYAGISTNGTTTPTLYFDHRAASNTGQFVFRNGTGGANTLLTISGTGAATFASSVTANGGISVPIGTASDFGTSGTSLLRIVSTGGVNYIQSAINNTTGGSAAPLVFTSMYAANEWMRITSSGNVGIGTTSPQQALQLGQVSVIAQDVNSMYVGANFGTNTNGYYIKSQYANQINFDSAQGNINFKIAGSGTAGTYISYNTAMVLTSNSNLLIGTTTDTGQSNHKLQVYGSTTRIRIDSSNNNSGVLLAESGTNKYSVACASGDFQIYSETSSVTRVNVTNAGDLKHIAYSTGQAILWTYNGGATYGFYNANNGTFVLTNSGVANVGSFNMSSGAYTATSDINKKKNIELSTLGLNEILQLIPKTYRFKTEDDDSKKNIGFIAQDVKDVIPYAYSENIIGDETFIGLEYTAFIPVLVKAIQELNQKFEDYKATHP